MTRIRRALLFTPGDDLRRLEKAAKSNVDTVILDLEDGIAANRKIEARRTAVAALRTFDYGRTERLIRLNSSSTALQYDDLRETIKAKPDGYVLPKVESVAEVKNVSSILKEAECEYGWPEGDIRLLAMIESALGVVRLAEIASSDERLEALILGAEDLAGDLGATRTPEGSEISYSRGRLVLVAAAFGLQAIDMVFVDFKNADGLTREASHAARLGYSGKTIIHPSQIEPVHAAFTPSAYEVLRAQQLVEMYYAYQARGVGAFADEGKMVDAPIIRRAEQILALAAAAGLLSSAKSSSSATNLSG